MNTPPVFAKIEQPTIETEIFTRLRSAIVGGQLALGQHLGEANLSEQLAVSRIPIREALRKLEQEGLVVRQPNRGCSVITFSERDVIEVFSLRSNLESMGYQWAIPHMTPADLAALRQLTVQQEQAVAAGNYEELARLDMRFHEYILAKANHSRLLKAWYEQHAQCQILLNLRFRRMANYTPDTVLRDHDAILDAIERGDAQAAITLTHEISERVSRECIEILADPAIVP
jgi:DNA-binding GntR family transcriptional regulator